MSVNRLIEKLQFQMNFNQEDIEGLCLVADDSFRDEGYIEYLGEENKFLKEMIDNLKALQSLEEELGIDLLTLFKALKDGIYLKEDNVGVISYPRLYFSFDYRSYCFEICFGSWVVKLKDYKKTWWLKKPKENDDD